MASPQRRKRRLKSGMARSQNLCQIPNFWHFWQLLENQHTLAYVEKNCAFFGTKHSTALKSFYSIDRPFKIFSFSITGVPRRTKCKRQEGREMKERRGVCQNEVPNRLPNLKFDLILSISLHGLMKQKISSQMVPKTSHLLKILLNRPALQSWPTGKWKK